MSSLIRSFDHWLHAPAPPERLAALRIAIGGFVTLYLLTNVGEFTRLADAPSDRFEPIGLAVLLDRPLSAPLVWLLFAFLLGTGLAFSAGLRVRISGPTFSLLVLAWTSYHSSWGQLLHFEHLFTIHLLILALAPTADTWTLGAKHHHDPNERYGWPIKLLALATATTYVLSGIAKLKHSGLVWFDTDTLANHIGYSTTRMQTIGGPRPPLARLVLENQWLIPPLAVGAMFVELGAPLALTGPRMRNLWVLATLFFHAGTAATMLVFFGYRGLGFALLPLFAVERVPDWLRAWRHRPSKSAQQPPPALPHVPPAD